MRSPDRRQRAGRVSRGHAPATSLRRSKRPRQAFLQLAGRAGARSGAKSVRRIGEQLREHKDDLAHAGRAGDAARSWPRPLGEVQEMIDICDFAVGLSRQLYGLTIASERPGHRLAEQWHPLGPVGVITAFNFPVAVWAWNAMLALVCGDPLVWKPSEKTPLCAMACQQIVGDVLAELPRRARGHCQPGDRRGPDVGQAIAASPRLAAGLGDRLGADGPGRGPNRRRAAGPLAAGTGRQQRRDRRAVGRSGTGAAGDRLRRGRHLRPALHDACGG